MPRSKIPDASGRYSAVRTPPPPADARAAGAHTATAPAPEPPDRPLDRLVGAARTVFLREGFSRTTIAAIARVARVSKATVYEHFASKEELFLAACQQVMSEAWGRVVPAFEAAGPDAARPEDAVDALLQLMPALVDTCPLFLELWALLARDPALRDRAFAAFRDYYQGFARAIEAVVERAAPGALQPGEALAHARALIAAVDGLCYQWLFLTDRVALTRTGQAIRAMWLAGLESARARARAER